MCLTMSARDSDSSDSERATLKVVGRNAPMSPPTSCCGHEGDVYMEIQSLYTGAGCRQGAGSPHIRQKGSLWQHTACEDAWNSVEWYFLGSCSQTPLSAAAGTMCSLTALASLPVAWLSPSGATTARAGTAKGCRPGSIRPSRRWNSVLASRP